MGLVMDGEWRSLPEEGAYPFRVLASPSASRKEEMVELIRESIVRVAPELDSQTVRIVLPKGEADALFGAIGSLRADNELAQEENKALDELLALARAR